MDLKEICLEEIALEGLEGVTLPTLWLRLENRQPKLGFELTDKLKEYIWSFIAQNENLGIYKIPEERLEPQMFDRFSHDDDSKIPLATAPDELGTAVEVYSTKALTDCEGVRGACINYYSRVDMKTIVSKLTYTVMSQLYEPRKLIIVAPQSMREAVLLGENMSSNIIKDMTDFMYCVLERVARARSQGELQSVLNKINFCDKKLYVHYVIDRLQALGLVVKKNHTYKRSDRNNRTFFQVLILLKRFDREHLLLSVRHIQNAIEILKVYQDCTLNLAELRDMLKLDKKHFHKMYNGLIKSGQAVIHDINPEKKTNVMAEKLITLTMKSDPAAQNALEDDDQDIQTMFTESSNSAIRPVVLERPLLYQSFAFVKDNGAKGVVQNDVLKFLKGYGHLEARNLCRNFDRHNLVNVVLVDQGRQRTHSFIPKNLSAQSEKSLEFSDEKKKMQQLLLETSKIVSQNDSLAIEYDTSMIESSPARSEKSSMETQTPETNASMTFADVEVGECFTDQKIDVESQLSRINYIMQEEYANNYPKKKWDAHLTARKIKRHNLILEQLNSEKIIEGFRTIQKCLSLAEEKEGVTFKIDRRTVIRLIDKMHYEGVLQHSVIPITHNGRTENYHFIMALDCPNTLFKSAVDQVRLKMLGDEKNTVARNSLEENQKMDLDELQIVMVNDVGRKERVKSGRGVKRKKPDEHS